MNLYLIDPVSNGSIITSFRSNVQYGQKEVDRNISVFASILICFALIIRHSASWF